MKDLFLAISDAIEDTGVIRWIDEDLGQLDSPTLPAVSWPCALISFQQGEWANLSAANQLGEPRIQVRLGFKLHERTHSRNTPAARASAVSYMDVVQAVHYALQGLSGPNFQGLSRLSFSTATRPDYRVWTLTYMCSYTDCPTDGGPNSTQYLPWATAGGTPPGPSLQLQPDIIISE